MKCEQYNKGFYHLTNFNIYKGTASSISPNITYRTIVDNYMYKTEASNYDGNSGQTTLSANDCYCNGVIVDVKKALII